MHQLKRDLNNMEREPVSGVKLPTIN